MSAPEDGDLFLSDRHPGSRRWAIVEDDGRSGWLYLTEPESTRVSAHCWLYNRIASPGGRDFGRGETPVVPAEFVHDPAPFPAPEADRVRFGWNEGGDGVAVFFDTDLIGYILLPARAGYSRNLAKAGPYGSPLDPQACARTFAAG